MSELKREWEEECQSWTGTGVFAVLVCLGERAAAAVCNVWGALGRELMDVLGREDFFFFSPTLAACSPCKSPRVLGGGWRRGTGLENIRRVADVPALIADET